MKAGVETLTRAGAAAEVQGLYGPFAFPERLLQKIWLDGDFDRARATTLDGRRLAVVQPGRWNLLGGPDFRSARLRFGEAAEVNGDVELHLHASDWAAHGHAEDAAYDQVVLHVVLFPPPAGHVTRGAGGREIPVLVLLPLLHSDLEEYAAQDVVETLANRPASQLLEELGPLPRGELKALLAARAAARWVQKVHFARLRIQRLGWAEACHQTALEILGYRFNRAPMLRLATALPLVEWGRPDFDPDARFESERSGWSLQGLRPANHPRRRLEQYAAWSRARPDWPERLDAFARRLPNLRAAETTSDARWEHGMTALREEWGAAVCAHEVGGTRFDNLVCDGFLPLLAAQTGRDLHGLWFHWFAGDLPPLLPKVLRQLEVFDGRLHPACHGAAQGLLGWMIERERARTVAPGAGA